MPKYTPGAVTRSRLDLGGYYLMTLGEATLKDWQGDYSMNVAMSCSDGVYYWKVDTDGEGEPATVSRKGKETDFHVCKANDLAVAAGIAGGDSEAPWEWSQLTSKRVLVQLKWSSVSSQNTKSYFNVERVLPASKAAEYSLGCDPQQGEPKYQESEQDTSFSVEDYE